MYLIDLFFGQDLNSAHMILLPHATLATQRDSPSVPSCLFHRGNPPFLVAIEYLLRPELIIVGWKDLRIWDGIALQLCIEMFLLIANLSLMAGNGRQIFTAVVDFSKGIPVFHRCIPKNITCYAEFMQAFSTFVNDNTVLPRVIAGVLASKEIIMGLCLLALGEVICEE